MVIRIYLSVQEIISFPDREKLLLKLTSKDYQNNSFSPPLIVSVRMFVLRKLII